MNEEYLSFLEIIQNRLKKHNQILTSNKKRVIEILFNNSKHKSVEEIIKLSKETDGEKLSYTTAYRILSSFELFGVVDSVLIDDKKRFELSYSKIPHYHFYCESCHKLDEFESKDINDLFMKELNSRGFYPTNFNVMINGVCEKCKKS